MYLYSRTCSHIGFLGWQKAASPQAVDPRVRGVSLWLITADYEFSVANAALNSELQHVPVTSEGFDCSLCTAGGVLPHAASRRGPQCARSSSAIVIHCNKLSNDHVARRTEVTFYGGVPTIGNLIPQSFLVALERLKLHLVGSIHTHRRI